MKAKLIVVLFLTCTSLLGQENPKERIKTLANEIESLVKEEKAALKMSLDSIENLEKNNDITTAIAAERKAQKAEASAVKIEKIVNERTHEISELTQQIVKNALEGPSTEDTTQTRSASIKIDLAQDDEDNTYKRTVNRFVFGFGLNNVLQDHQISSLDDTPYSIWNSNFVELGWSYRTALSQETNLVNVFYGASIQWNELKLFDNLYHVNVDGQTLIMEHPDNLKKSKLRNTQLIVPLGFEFDFTKKPISNDNTFIKRNKGVKLGLGAYAGLRINSKQIIKFEKPRDIKKEKITADYNINNLTYGLTGYLGYKDTSLYLKYDLHPLFKDTETTNISLGIKFDL